MNANIFLFYFISEKISRKIKQKTQMMHFKISHNREERNAVYRNLDIGIAYSIHVRKYLMKRVRFGKERKMEASKYALQISIIYFERLIR